MTTMVKSYLFIIIFIENEVDHNFNLIGCKFTI